VFEDFVKRRTSELLIELSASGVSFANLPDKLRRATTIDSIKAIAFQYKLQDQGTQVQYVQDNAEHIASTKLAGVHLSDLAFFKASSNISMDNFGDSIKAFAIQNPWGQVSGLSSRSGLSALPGNSVFTAFAQRRHNAAHDPNASVSETDLSQSLLDASGLASAYDILVSRAVRSIAALVAPPLPNTWLVTDHLSIKMRFIRNTLGGFWEKREGSARFFRKSSTTAVLRLGALNRATKEGGVLLIFNAMGLLEDWTV
jgi:hypothetical protein